ncbi:MAG: metalloregulator ArsR/SmtB family transcription factor [Candidatus Methylacidiphilales bacterium]
MSTHSKRKAPVLSDAQIDQAARLFAVLAEPARLHLLRALMKGEKTVSQLVDMTGIKQGTVSKHLGILYQAGFLQRKRDGAYVRYEISDPTVQHLCGLMCARMQREVEQQYWRLMR